MELKEIKQWIVVPCPIQEPGPGQKRARECLVVGSQGPPVLQTYTFPISGHSIVLLSNFTSDMRNDTMTLWGVVGCDTARSEGSMFKTERPDLTPVFGCFHTSGVQSV